MMLARAFHYSFVCAKKQTAAIRPSLCGLEPSSRILQVLIHPLVADAAHLATSRTETVGHKIVGFGLSFFGRETISSEITILTGVDVRVLLHVGLLVEAFAAVLAGIRSGVTVDQQMSR